MCCWVKLCKTPALSAPSAWESLTSRKPTLLLLLLSGAPSPTCDLHSNAECLVFQGEPSECTLCSELAGVTEKTSLPAPYCYSMI